MKTHHYVSHQLNIRCDLEVINGTFLLLLENAALLKLERFLSRCCFLSSYEWKKTKTTKPKQKNPSKMKQNKQTPNPKDSLSYNTSEETLYVWVPVAHRNPAQQHSQCPTEYIPLFVNKFNELLSRYILSSVWAEGTRIWAHERLGCNGYTLPLLSLRHGKGQLLSSKMCHCYKYDCIIYCKLFSKFIANY